jgi:hypothetical protein
MIVACAIVHDDPPTALLADDIDTLQWVLAIKLVAQSRSDTFKGSTREQLRAALLDERWADAVLEWISATGVAVDVFPSFDVYSADRLPPDVAAVELQFTPLFRD